MNSLVKNIELAPKHPPRPEKAEVDVRELYGRTMKRYPKTMARLGE
jgi:hypothetical protein